MIDNQDLTENIYKTLFEHSGTAIVLIEEDTTISLVNSHTERLLGYSREEIENKMKWTQVVSKEVLEQMKKYHELRRKSPESVPNEYETTVIDKYGNERHVIVNLNLIPGTKKSIASVIDITILKILTKQKEKAYKQIGKNIEQYHMLVDRIRNPLNTILNIVELRDEEIKESVLEQIKNIAESVEAIEQGLRETERVRRSLQLDSFVSDEN